MSAFGEVACRAPHYTAQRQLTGGYTATTRVRREWLRRRCAAYACTPALSPRSLRPNLPVALRLSMS